MGNKFIEKRINIAKDMEHAKADKMKTIIKLVNDADIFCSTAEKSKFYKYCKYNKISTYSS